jgi:hypothetical protein
MREPASTFVTYARRLAQSVTALHNHPPQAYGPADVNRLSKLRARLNNIVEGLRTGHIQVPASSAVPAKTGEAADQLDVLERQVRVLENAAERLVSASSRNQSLHA